MLTQTMPQRVMRRVELLCRERETPGRCSELTSHASGCIAIRLTTDQKVVGSSPAGRATNCKGFWLTMAFERWPYSPTSVSAQDGGGLSPVKGPSHPETEQWRVRQTTTSGVLLSDSTLRLAGQGRDRRWHQWLRPPPARRRQRRGARGCPNPGMRPRPR